MLVYQCKLNLLEKVRKNNLEKGNEKKLSRKSFMIVSVKLTTAQ